MKLVVFDFDGTLTKSDSFLEFIKFSKGRFKFFFGFLILLPILILYKIQIIKNWRAKECVLQLFFKNDSLNVFSKYCHSFVLNRIDAILRPAAMDLFYRRINENAKVIIVTASIEDWIKPWAAIRNVEVIGTRLQVVNNRITGKIDGKNCYGLEKVIRLKEKVDLLKYTEIEVYGDSKGDTELMEIATTGYFKYF